MEKIVVLAIPLYFISMFFEAWLSANKKKNYFKLKDSFGNLGTGIIMQLFEVFSKAPIVAGYVYLYEHFNLERALGLSLWAMDITSLQGAMSWAIVFLLDDLIYYFFHRHSHEVNLLWSAHVVHHSSEEYNYSVALRQSALQGLFATPYRCILPLLGVPVVIVLTCHGLNLIYQFFLHTRFVGKLGFFEKVFNTPSHHRVHHARQGKYLDRNYAGVFIIWDKMFGTFMEEEEEPKYGIYPRFQSYDPIRANVMPLVELIRYFRLASGKEKWNVLFAGPLWIYEKFKKGKDLNVLENGDFPDRIAFVLFSASLALALVVLFVPTLGISPKILLVLLSLALLGIMGHRLDSPKKKTSDLMAPA